MRWFRHMASAARNEKLVLLEERHGFAGVGRFWRVLELVAEQCDEKDQPEISFSWGMWMRSLRFATHEQARSYLAALDELRLISAVMTAERCLCSVPNLLKLREAKPIQGRLEKRREEKRRKDTPLPPKGETPFDQFWKAYPKKVGKKAAERAWRNAKVNGSLTQVLAALEQQKTSAKWKEENGRFIPNPATWINQGRWLDEPTKIETWKDRFLRGEA